MHNNVITVNPNLPSGLEVRLLEGGAWLSAGVGLLLVLGRGRSALQFSLV